MAWDQADQDALTHVVEQLEDITESLAVLIDDEARAELQSILVGAGLDGEPLVRKDAKASDTAAD
jgi:hypothetical protein